MLLNGDHYNFMYIFTYTQSMYIPSKTQKYVVYKVINREHIGWFHKLHMQVVFSCACQAGCAVTLLASMARFHFSLKLSDLNQLLTEDWVVPRFLAINSFSIPVRCGSLLNLFLNSDN